MTCSKMSIIRTFFATSFLLLIFTGCSKNYYEPHALQGKVNYDGNLPAAIAFSGYAGATLENGQVITEKGLQSYHLPKGYHYICGSGDKVIASSACKRAIIFDISKKKSKSIDLPREVLAALFIPKTTKIAFLLEDNSYGIYDYSIDKVIAKYSSDAVESSDIRIANPIMLSELVLVPTLDGKLVILNAKSGEKVREIIVGKGKEFNNIIFLKVIGNRLVAATSHRIISVSPKMMDSQNMEIRDVLFVKNGIYILRKDGKVTLTDLNLKILNQKKFPFAHFVGAIYGEYIYLIEKEGYVIAIDQDLQSSNVFELPDDIDGWFFATKDRLYYGNNYFKLHHK